MQKVDPNKKSKKPIWKSAAIVGACALCFAAGLAVPYMVKQVSPVSSNELDKFEEAYSLLKDGWYYGKDVENIDNLLIEQALMGMTTLAQDRHTNYFDLENAKAFSDSLAGSNVGIGVSFYPGEQGQMVVKQVYINSTADRAGILPGDQIVKVGDKEAGVVTTDELVDYIKSMDGKQVAVQVKRGDEILDLNVTPGVFDSTVSAQVLEDNIGYIDLSSFSADSGKDFTEAIGRMQREGATNLVVDLRNNTGGYLSAAREIASSFLPDDTVIFKEQTKDGQTKELKTDSQYAQVDFDHIYILQNKNTASASEVLIGALKDNMPEKITTVGTSTYGKGTEQVTVPFSDGTSLKYTVAEWLTPNGTSINKIGFQPDVEVALDEVSTVTYTGTKEGEELRIEPDSVNPNAAAVQVYLRFLGYPAERSDNYFSAASSEALKQFQADNGLEATGVVDQATFDKLLDTVGNKLSSQGIDQDDELWTAITIIKNGGQVPSSQNPDQAENSESSDDGSDQVIEDINGEEIPAEDLQPETIDEQFVE